MSTSTWDDLKVRVIVGLLLAVLGIGGIWVGGTAFHLLVSAATGVMIWELIRMLAPEKPGIAVQLGILAGAVMASALFVPIAFLPPLLIAILIVSSSRLEAHKPLLAGYGAVVLFGALGVILIRNQAGLNWMLWLALVVVATDVMGYFAGRFLGGPKFWPRVSPKKTWSGTIAGWGGAVLVSLFFIGTLGIGAALVLVGLLTSLASQLGDIAESAVKRKVGVKDASDILPGHGGVLDRFDGLLGAALFVLILGFISGNAGAL